MLPPNPVKGEIEIWCESDYAVRCYRLTARYQSRPAVSVYDLEGQCIHDGWYTVEDLIGDLGERVWPSLEDYCHDLVSGGSDGDDTRSWDLVEVLEALGVDVGPDLEEVEEDIE